MLNRTRGERPRLRRDVTLLLVAATAVAALPTPEAAVFYEIRWWSLVTLSRFVDEEQETVRGERRGQGRMVYEPLGEGRSYIRFEGAAGDGEGVLGPTAPEWLVFPTALDVGMPPPPPHLTTGTVSYVGDPARPEMIEITFVEGFICRATPAACDGVASWSREFAATATPTTPLQDPVPGR
jgi:hypothetical protein